MREGAWGERRGASRVARDAGRERREGVGGGWGARGAWDRCSIACGMGWRVWGTRCGPGVKGNGVWMGHGMWDEGRGAARGMRDKAQGEKGAGRGAHVCGVIV